jgi:hypothetical protein
MSIENLEIIDVVSTDNNGNVILTISDHSEWDSKNEHLLILQDKINTYLSAIESGDLYEKYPKAKYKNISIRVITLYDPNHDGREFLDKTKVMLEKAGYGFEFTQKSTK